MALQASSCVSSSLSEVSQEAFLVGRWVLEFSVVYSHVSPCIIPLSARDWLWGIPMDWELWAWLNLGKTHETNTMKGFQVMSARMLEVFSWWFTDVLPGVRFCKWGPKPTFLYSNYKIFEHLYLPLPCREWSSSMVKRYGVVKNLFEQKMGKQTWCGRYTIVNPWQVYRF